MSKPKYYITTAIAYTSGKPHIGNTYEAVLADAIARYKRQQGYDVFFQTGTDEHGQKIELKAEEAGVTPKEFVDNAADQIKKIWDLMDTSYDKFIRTTDEDHEKQVQKIFKKLYEDSVLGRITTEQFQMLSGSYTEEQNLITVGIPQKESEIQHLRETVSGTDSFLDKAKRYTDITELTPELLRLFIEKIVVHEKEVKWSKHAPQTVEIYYNGIGYVGSGQQDVEEALEAPEALEVPQTQDTEKPRQAS